LGDWEIGRLGEERGERREEGGERREERGERREERGEEREVRREEEGGEIPINGLVSIDIACRIILFLFLSFFLCFYFFIAR
jgi:hypothetical protein